MEEPQHVAAAAFMWLDVMAWAIRGIDVVMPLVRFLFHIKNSCVESSFLYIKVCVAFLSVVEE